MKDKSGNTELILRYRCGDSEALERLVENNMGLVKSAVRRYLGKGTEYDDLIQIGSLGLIKAVGAFDTELGFEFSTYAFTMIVGELRRHFRDDGIIKVSRSIRHYCATMLKIKEEFVLRNGYEPPISYLAEMCGISVEDAVFYLGALSPVESLSGDNEEENPLENRIGNDDISEFIERYALREAVDSLDAEERLILHLRYDLSYTQSMTAKRLGITQVKVSRSEKKIMEKLRQRLTV